MEIAALLDRLKGDKDLTLGERQKQLWECRRTGRFEKAYELTLEAVGVFPDDVSLKIDLVLSKRDIGMDAREEARRVLGACAADDDGFGSKCAESLRGLE